MLSRVNSRVVGSYQERVLDTCMIQHDDSSRDTGEPGFVEVHSDTSYARYFIVKISSLGCWTRDVFALDQYGTVANKMPEGCL